VVDGFVICAILNKIHYTIWSHKVTVDLISQSECTIWYHNVTVWFDITPWVYDLISQRDFGFDITTFLWDLISQRECTIW
jgi:hypothetical protein